MNSSRLGCLSINAFVAALITILVLGGVFILEGSAMFSPGALNALASGEVLGGVHSHAETDTNCGACHAPFWSQDTMSDRCLDCHSGLLDEAKDFHIIMMAQGEIKACQSCHTEHHGAEARLTNKQMDGFPHDQVGFALKAHLRKNDGTSFACADCHLNTFSKPALALDACAAL